MRGDIALFLGMVTLVGGGIVLAVVFIFGSGGGGGSACDESLAPLGGGEIDISQMGFQAEDVGLTRMIQAAQVGNLEAAEAAFFGDVHNFTHNVDPSLREVDEELAKELCEAVIDIEEDLAFSSNAGLIAAKATRVRDLVRDAAEALGYARPGG